MRRWIDLGVLTLVILQLVIALKFLREMTFIRSEVKNTSNLEELQNKELPGFIHQTQKSPALQAFRHRIEPLVRDVPGDLEKAIMLRRWVRDLQSDDPSDWEGPYPEDTEDPARLLEEQAQGIHSACRRFSYVLCGALLSVGLDSRIVNVSREFRRGDKTHTMVEVWIEARKRWVLMDPTLDTLMLVDGVPASLADVYLAAWRNGSGEITFQRNGSTHVPEPQWTEAYRQYFRHLYVARTNGIFDGYAIRLIGRKRISFLHFSSGGAGPYPTVKKQFLMLLCSCSGLMLVIMTLRCSVHVARLSRALWIHFIKS